MKDALERMSTVDLVKELVKSLVDQPEKLIFDISGGTSLTLIEVKAEEEAGKIIGKKGRLAAAIRDLLMAIGAREQMRYEFVIVGSERRTSDKNTDS